MTATLSMVLGITFVVCAIAAVVLQAWLWSPKYWNAETKKSHAPPFWMAVHRLVGWVYATIYVVMMFAMLPRLWEYQIELPARTVVHALAAITIGVVLVVKISILRFFRHFEESMPTLGLVLLVATIVLGTFSIPFALRARGSEATFAPENVTRVRTILGRLELGEGPDLDSLASVEGFERGRDVVMQRCASCHDLRTVIAEPRTGAGWLSTCRRMQDKPTLAEPLTDDEVLFATAYLVAITPVLHDDVRRREDDEDERLVVADRLEEAATEAPDAGPLDAGPLAVLDAGIARPDAGTFTTARPRRRRDAGTEPEAVPTPEPEPTSEPTAEPDPDPEPHLVYSAALAEDILGRRCIDCHGMEDVESYGGADRAGWLAVVRRMIRRGSDCTEDEARILAQYLASRYPAEHP